ncbi:hypothetical protein DERF_013642 [Dermatophagoides farinae]|uniref:Uncharacterized protein n=1 Tax=Dermatophagoides farinae TaxID=6954 RepID=A0A922HMT8_DERFA|nr:uncharacterized protein LOC124499406 [Dermatophagoides farinae]KAH7645469.1 hypothetical protein HUG17_1007 [Dermatophagoides farinae]KAH9497676.1 hypothetical protein DERF_013642 [Dermatophagoides farinae]
MLSTSASYSLKMISISYLSLFLLFTTSSLIQCRSILSAQQEQILPQIFPPERINVSRIAKMANHTLMELFTHANAIVNSTGADSVLLEIDDHANKNNNNSIKVLAVAKSDIPKQEDLMKKFNLYFVNLTESPLSFINNNHHTKTSKPISYNRRTYWQIFVDFLRNQANAVLGAMMIPVNVGMNAAIKAAETHAEYVLSESPLGSVISAPVILKAISIPNKISQHIVDIASNQMNNLETFNEQTKLMADNGIKTLANGLNNGTKIVSNVTSHYVIRPIGAFTGFNLNRTGHLINNIGKSIANTGLNIHLSGEHVGSNAEKLVSAGATAIAWGLDNTVKF